MSLWDTSRLGRRVDVVDSLGMMPAREPADRIETVEQQLAELQERDRRLAEDIEGGREARRQLAARIRALEAALNVMRAGDAMSASEMQAGSIADAIAVLLRRHGAMRAKDLATALQDAGKLLRTEGAASTLYKTLSRDARFQKVEGRRGYWELK
jgi:hypothetical protein